MRIEFLKHRKRGLKRQVTINMGYGQAILLYAIYIMPSVLTNPGESINEFIVDSPGTHTLCPRGERKLPEYDYSQITTNLNR